QKHLCKYIHGEKLQKKPNFKSSADKLDVSFVLIAPHEFNALSGWIQLCF
ncbi:MAG: hypothetical protein ACI9JN_000506, partial [Bacteroidia bacterium]